MIFGLKLWCKDFLHFVMKTLAPLSLDLLVCFLGLLSSFLGKSILFCFLSLFG